MQEYERQAITIEEVQSEEDFVDILSTFKYILLFFKGEKCPGCVAYEEIIREAAVYLYEDVIKDDVDMDENDFIFLLISVDETPQIARHYSVTGLPTTIALLDGQEMGQTSGVLTVEQLSVFAENNWEII
ncbi:MAG: thioredoxin family protein [Paraclostridium sp.]